MSNQDPSAQDHPKRDENWASPVNRLKIDSVPEKAVNLNVDGRKLAGPGGTPVISTGIMVIYADDESFSFMTSQGHMLSGIITFRSFFMEGDTIAEAQAFVRASDPLYELGFRMGIGHKSEDEFWKTTLHNLALNFGVDAYAIITPCVPDY
jgi:hypothetical protein